MNRIIALIAIALSSVITNAADYKLLHNTLIAPSVPDAAALTNLTTGQIVFDNSTNMFRGVDSFGNWQSLTSSDRVERVRFGGPTPGTKCTASPGTDCTIYSKSAGINYVRRNSGDGFVINFNSGTFSERPTCTCSAMDPGTDYFVCSVSESGDENSLAAYALNRDSFVSEDAYVEVLCVGPR